MAIESATNDVKKALESNDAKAINRTLDALMQAQQKAAENLYKHAPGADGGSVRGGRSGPASRQRQGRRRDRRGDRRREEVGRSVDLYSLLGLARDRLGSRDRAGVSPAGAPVSPGRESGRSAGRERYQQIQEAYRVLADAERRREYDRGGGARPGPRSRPPSRSRGSISRRRPKGRSRRRFRSSSPTSFSTPRRTPRRRRAVRDLELSIRVSFDDAMRGASVPVSVTRQDRCVACAGQGRVSRAATMCPACQGEGIRRWARGHMVFSKPCEACDGQGTPGERALPFVPRPGHCCPCTKS